MPVAIYVTKDCVRTVVTDVKPTFEHDENGDVWAYSAYGTKFMMNSNEIGWLMNHLGLDVDTQDIEAGECRRYWITIDLGEYV